MTKNIGDADRTLRMAIGATTAVLFFRDTIGGIAGIVLGVISAWLLATSLTGWCPFYALLRISTSKPGDVTAAKR